MNRLLALLRKKSRVPQDFEEYINQETKRLGFDPRRPWTPNAERPLRLCDVVLEREPDETFYRGWRRSSSFA